MNNSIQNINELPSIVEMKKISQGLALADAIIMPEWEHRYFSFNCNWDGKGNEMMASMRDGSGSEYFLHFSDKGVAGKVLSEHPQADASLLLKNVPASFSGFKGEAAFSLDNATFFFWRDIGDSEWSVLPDNLSDYPLLGFITGNYPVYISWAESYYEKDIDSTVLKEVFTSLNVTSDQVTTLNPDLTLEELREDLQEIIGK